MSDWAKPKPSEILDSLISDELRKDIGDHPPLNVWALHRALKRFIDEDAEQRQEQRRPDAQV